MRKQLFNARKGLFVILLAVLGCFAFRAEAVSFYFTSDAEINEGEVYDGGGIYNVATIDMYGGTVLGDLAVNDDSTLNIWGGLVYEIYNRSIVNIYGGEVKYHIRVEDESLVNIYGGTIMGDIDVWDSGILNISGGNLNLTSPFFFSEIATVTIYGYDFNYNSGSFILSGFLADDNPFSISGINPDDYVRLHLIPEPTTFLLFGIGCLALRRRKRA